MFWETDSTPINQNINTITQKNLKKVESTCREPLTPQRTSTYERPFTREGNYLVVKSLSSAFGFFCGDVVVHHITSIMNPFTDICLSEYKCHFSHR